MKKMSLLLCLLLGTLTTHVYAEQALPILGNIKTDHYVQVAHANKDTIRGVYFAQDRDARDAFCRYNPSKCGRKVNKVRIIYKYVNGKKVPAKKRILYYAKDIQRNELFAY